MSASFTRAGPALLADHSAVEFPAETSAGKRLSAEGNTEYTPQRWELIMRRAAFILAVLAGACSSDSAANVAGTYTIALTIQQNGAASWAMIREPLRLASTGGGHPRGSKVTAQVQGAAALGLGLATGSATFTGTVLGNSLDLSISGTVSGSSGTCAFTRNAHLVGTVAGRRAHRQRDLQLRHQQDRGLRNPRHPAR